MISASPSKMKLTILVVIALFLPLSITPSASKAQSAKATAVVIDTVTLAPITQTVPILGHLVATQSGNVAALTTGPLDAFRFNVGDRVKKDDIIAVLVKDSLEAGRELWLAQVTQAKSRVQTTQAQLELLNQEQKRLKSLETSSAFSQAKLDDKKQEVIVMKSTVAEHKAALDVIKANLMMAEIDLYNADIRAPYDSVIIIRHKNQGSFVRAGDPVVTLLNDKTLEIEANVPTERIASLLVGTKIKYQLSINQEAVGNKNATVRAIIPDENPLTRTRAVRFSADLRNEGNLAANQSVMISIPISAPRSVITVHKDAVINKRGNTVVFIAHEGKASMHTVKLGASIDGRFVVLSGLAEGDLAIVRGNERLRPDQDVKIQEQ